MKFSRKLSAAQRSTPVEGLLVGSDTEKRSALQKQQKRNYWAPPPQELLECPISKNVT